MVYTYFFQKVKTLNGRQEFYPIPPKIVAPNLQSRQGEMQVSVPTATALRNVERDQWQTTYNRQHTGLGPANPNKLDNFDEKLNFYHTTGVTDDNIVRHCVLDIKNTFI